MKIVDRQLRRGMRRVARAAMLVGLMWMASCGAPGQIVSQTDATEPSAITADSAQIPAMPPVAVPPMPASGAAPESPTLPPPPDLTPRPYSGIVTVLFHNEPGFETDLRWRGGRFVALRRGIDPAPLNAILRRYQITTVERGVPTLTEEQLAIAYRYLVDHNINGAYDWNGLYRIPIADEATAQAVVEALRSSSLVRSARVRYAPFLLGTVGPTPDLVPQQGYLFSNENAGGLNVVAAWEPPYNLTGQGVRMQALEEGSIAGHEDLPVSEEGLWYILGKPGLGYTVQHGTAMAGIIRGTKNTFGVTGISHGSPVHFQTQLLAGELAYYAAHPEGPPPWPSEGDILVVAEGNTGPANGVYETLLPAETDVEYYLAIQQYTGLGVHVVVGVGNSGIPLVEWPEPEFGGAPYLTQESGSIMVGASLGKSHAKNPWSNCGPRVDVYAWGAGVVTAGWYGDLFPGNALKADDNASQWYTAQFGHTSAATAQIAGVVALLEEYVEKTLCPPPPTVAADGNLGFMTGSSVYYRCFLPPKTMRQLLKDSGVGSEANTLVIPDPTDDTGYPDNIKTLPAPDCGIGVQPDVGKALQLLDSGAYQPAIQTTLSPTLSPLGKTVVSGIRYDLDADGRADLIAWSRERTWYVDLSATPAPDGAADGFGAWDLILEPPPFPDGAMLFPVVHDYNSDGHADLALYDSTNGQWYIRYTDEDLLAEAWGAWDRIIDYSADPAWQPRSRPVPGDYNGDHWLDPALTTPDGHWLIDEGGFTAELVPPSGGGTTWGVTYDDAFGGVDTDVPFLTPEQLAAAPGWAYAPVLYEYYSGTDLFIRYRSPDGVPGGNRLFARYPPDFVEFFSPPEGSAGLPAMDAILVEALLDAPDLFEVPDIGGCHSNYAVKRTDGSFPFLCGSYDEPTDTWTSVIGTPQPLPLDGFGNLTCRPVPADYDGDGWDDRAVLCPHGEWRIAYTDKTWLSVANEPAIVNNGGPFQALPAHVYPGGVAYQTLLDIYGHYNFGCSGGAGAEPCSVSALPPPVGPYFAECIAFWATHPLACLHY